MVNKRSGIKKKLGSLILVLAMIFCGLPAAAITAVPVYAYTTAESGPMNPHTPTTYTYDRNQSYKLPQGNYSNYLQSRGIFFPGDVINLVPDEETPDPDKHYHHGVGGYSLGGVDGRTTTDGYGVDIGTEIGPFEVTEIARHGDGEDEYTFITQLTVLRPAMLKESGSLDPAAKTEDGDKWALIHLSYIELPEYVPIQFNYYLGGTLVDNPEGLQWYGHDADNPQVIWMEDIAETWDIATDSDFSKEDIGPVFNIYRPYIEGYWFNRFESAGGWDFGGVYPTKINGAENKVDGQWESASFYFEGLQRQFMSNFTNTKIGSEDKPITITLVYNHENKADTMTLNGNGGTVGGYSSRILDTYAYDYGGGFFNLTNEFPSVYLPDRKGYTFYGWCSDAAGENMIASADLDAEEMFYALRNYCREQSESNVNLYAKWEIDNTEPEKVPVASIKLNKTSLEMATSSDKTMSTQKLNVTVTPSDATNKELTWTSSDPSVARVEQNGNVTALKYGKVTITVASKDNPKATAKCTVQTRFNDVAGTNVKGKTGYQYYYDPVYWAANNNITKGYKQTVKDGTFVADSNYFGPSRDCTRAEMIIFMWRANGRPSASGSLSFSDTKNLNKNTDTYKAILWGYTNGIIKGYTSGKYKGQFRPNDSVVRKDCLIMLYRLAKKPPVSGKITFPDVLKQKYKTNSDTYRAILWGVKKGITAGYSDGNFQPMTNCQREHIVTFLWRYKGKPTP